MGMQARPQPNEFQWVNKDLIAKGLQPEQYNSIGRGALAQCKDEATSYSQRKIVFPDCPKIFENGDFGLLEQCSESNIRHLREKVQTAFTDVFTSCMAGKGWLWVKIR